MNIGPNKLSGELESAYRFRMLTFSFVCLILFGLLLGLMLAIRPEAANSEFPFLIMFLWFATVMAFGASVLATFGYLIGTVFSLFLERYRSIGLLWPKVKIIFAAIFLLQFFFFSLYWFLYGLFNMEVLPFAKQAHYQLISSSEDPVLFWLSVLIWGAIGTWGTLSLLNSLAKKLAMLSRED